MTTVLEEHKYLNSEPKAKKHFTFAKMVEDYEKAGGKITEINPTPKLIKMLEQSEKDYSNGLFEEI